MDIFSVENLTFSYPKAKNPALENVTFSVKSGEFAVICGQSGCGKTTLLRLMKRELAPFGEKSGRILYGGAELSALNDRDAAREIGFVTQNPENQIVTDKVWHELAFGLENIGTEPQIIRRRVGEMASFFGIQAWFRADTASLSGGQKQLLNLAAVMVMQPNALLLDEPTSQLDPIAASDFIRTLRKLNEELGLTIILAEHCLEDVFPAADNVIVLEGGRVLTQGPPREVAERLKNHPMQAGLPGAARIFSGLTPCVKTECPLTVKDGRVFLSEHFTNKINHVDIPAYIHSPNVAAELKNVWFRYGRDAPDVLRGASFSVYEGEIFCVLGGNGTGKTTALNVLSGLDKAYRGQVFIGGKKISHYKNGGLYRRNLALLPQNPETVFLKDSVREDLEDFEDFRETCNDMTIIVEKIVALLDIKHLLDKHPYDLSGGEQQKCALAKMLMLQPKILLLDEPTKGLDAFAKNNLTDILKTLKQQGMTIVVVTHDVEFAAVTGDRCALFFDGAVLSADTPNAFFAENNFYTTAANRIARHLYKNAVTCEEVVALCQQNAKES